MPRLAGFVAGLIGLCTFGQLVVHAAAQTRGLTVELRAVPEATAPVSERVELYKSSYALVIGNDGYTGGWPRLNNAVADAVEVANALKERGFEVTLKKDLDGIALRDTLKEFFAIKGSDPEARLLLWYAGHGHSIKSEGFLVPTDAPLASEPEFKLKALHMRDFGGLMRLADSKHVLAIFDSCFSGTIFTTRAGAVPAAITSVTTRATRQFMTSGDADQQVSDDGTFRRLFLRAMAGESTADSNGDGYLTGTELGLFMSTEMTNYTEQAQTPRYGKLRDPDYDRGDFVFALPGRMEAVEATLDDVSTATGGSTDIASAMAEIALWTSVVGSEDPKVVQTYLDQYPTGHFSKTAKARIEEINALITQREEAAAAQETKGGQEPAPASGEAAGTQTPKPAEATERAMSQAEPGDPEQPSEQPALQLEGGINLTVIDGAAETDWLPQTETGGEGTFSLVEQKLLPENFFGSGEAGGELSTADAEVSAGVGSQGYKVAGSAWRFSDPQGDSQYKIEGDWVHMRAPANHDIWDCRRKLAPILSVPAPNTESWSAQVWFQLPARIGRSHVGLVVWNGIETDRPTRALYFGPADTNNVPVNGSYREDCSGGSRDIAAMQTSRGRFNVEYTGGRGWLRISKSGDRLTFHFKSPFMHNWREVGSMLTEAKDGLVHVGLIAKTWGNEPVVASFSDFRIIPGHFQVEKWIPSYFATIADRGVATFQGKEYSDFEWNDPNGDSIHQIDGGKVRMKASGGRDIWDCHRKSAPILSVDVPPVDRWTAEVDFDLPARIGHSHAGLVLWNSEFEDAPVHSLYFGPANTDIVTVSGSNAVDCSSGAQDLSNQFGSEGTFTLKYNRGSGKLRIARDGPKVSFYFKAPEKRNWEHVGTTLASVRDDFTKIGFIAKTWGGEPLNVVFSNFRIIAGEMEPDRWFPAYYAKLKTGQPIVFSGKEFADFEWSDPDGNSVHEIRGSRIRLQTTGGHGSVWDCNRNKAPFLTVAVPPRDAWVAQARFRIPERAARTSANLVLWNGAEHGGVKALVFGPSDTKGVYVSGSYSDDCSGNSKELAKHEGNNGSFELGEGGTEGILQIVKFGPFYKFGYYDPEKGEWAELGTLKSSVKDNFSRIGMAVTSWGGDPIEAEFSDFTIVPGLFN